ncbi:MAG: hypothetical protein CML68_23020 [Rhodobacteraceae bacterium]|nr:hypothetical protein [Paracoccaceae bacterium]
MARPLDLTIRIAPPRDLGSGAPLPPDHPVARQLAGLAQAEHTRGAMLGVSSVSGIWVSRRDWRVLPRRQALIRAGTLHAP